MGRTGGPMWEGMIETYIANCDLLSQLDEQVKHFWRRRPSSWRECLVDIEETYRVLDWPVLQVWESHSGWESNGRYGRCFARVCRRRMVRILESVSGQQARSYRPETECKGQTAICSLPVCFFTDTFSFRSKHPTCHFGVSCRRAGPWEAVRRSLRVPLTNFGFSQGVLYLTNDHGRQMRDCLEIDDTVVMKA